MEISRRCSARVGLLGNPSDGYFGKTISFSLNNFSATVRLRPSPHITVDPHPVHDLTRFASLDQLGSSLSPASACGGVRLLLSLCRCFHRYCAEHGIALPDGKNFTLSYDTNIPRQAGLSGSSAIVAAGLQCLVEFFGVEAAIPVELRPSLVLRVETDLGITAGLQDRVIQIYGGLVYMDFNEGYFKERGFGKYERLDVNLLPRLHVVYADNPSDSGKVHSPVRQLWLAGDETIRGCMEEVASLAEKGQLALKRGDRTLLADLMNQNFDLRRRMFGDSALGLTNIRMVEIARSVGAAAKFTGSGGAVVVFCPNGEEQISNLAVLCEQNGFRMIEAEIGEAQFSK